MVACIIISYTADRNQTTGRRCADSKVAQSLSISSQYTFADNQTNKAHGLYANSSDGNTFGAWWVENQKDTFFGGPVCVISSSVQWIGSDLHSASHRPYGRWYYIVRVEYCVVHGLNIDKYGQQQAIYQVCQLIMDYCACNSDLYSLIAMGVQRMLNPNAQIFVKSFPGLPISQMDLIALSVLR